MLIKSLTHLLFPGPIYFGDVTHENDTKIFCCLIIICKEDEGRDKYGLGDGLGLVLKGFCSLDLSF